MSVKSQTNAAKKQKDLKYLIRLIWLLARETLKCTKTVKTLRLISPGFVLPGYRDQHGDAMFVNTRGLWDTHSSPHRPTNNAGVTWFGYNMSSNLALC